MKLHALSIIHTVLAHQRFKDDRYVPISVRWFCKPKYCDLVAVAMQNSIMRVIRVLLIGKHSFNNFIRVES